MALDPTLQFPDPNTISLAENSSARTTAKQEDPKVNPVPENKLEGDPYGPVNKQNTSAPIGPVEYWGDVNTATGLPDKNIKVYQMPQTVADALGTGLVPPKGKDATEKNGKKYGVNDKLGRSKGDKETPPDASAINKARDEKKKQNSKLDQKHPTAISQDSQKNIHDAFMNANPQSLGAVLTKAMQSMIMLKMMNKLTSPAGILSMASGGIGGALQGMAGAAGLGPMMGAMNQVMGQLSNSGLLTQSRTDALHTGMVGMMTNVAVGALSRQEIAAAQSTVSTVSYAMNAIASGNASGAVDALVYFGGPAFGLTPGSLASRIALIGPSGRVTSTGIYNGVRIYTTVTTSSNPHLTNNIPILTGAEHIAIATAAVSDIAGGLSHALGIDNPIGSTLDFVSKATGAVSDLTAGAAALSSAFPKINSFTHTALGGIINSGTDNIISGGLNKVLGVPTSGLLGAATTLLPAAGAAILDVIQSSGPLNLNSGKINAGMREATKALALSRASFNVAQNIFGNSRAEAIVQAVDAAANLAAAIGGPISHITAFGDVIHSSPVGAIQKAVQTGTQVAIGNGLMRV